MQMDELRRSANSFLWNGEKIKNIYTFPVQYDNDIAEAEIALSKGTPNDELYRVGRFLAAKSPETHIGPYKWAIDFLVPDGT